MPIARFGGGCPRWGIQRAFRLPGETIAALVEAPEEARYVTFARAVPRTAAPGLVMIVLGCEAKHCAAIGYADALGDAAIPIGPACHLCERPRCPQRALPPVTRALDLNLYQRPVAPYPFRAT
jgi:predicted transcriptional regulator